VQSSFSDDEFIRENRSRSILCLPLIKQTKLVGVLYLENNQAPHVFTPARVAILRLLASQAAISLENAGLYSDLRSAEAHLAEAQRLSRMGSWVWDTVSNRIVMSEQHCELFGFTREQLDQSYQLIQNAIHPDDRADLQNAVESAVRAGINFSCEFRGVMPDGSVKHFHSRGGPSTHEYSGAGEFTGTVMDITERKQSENEMRKLVSLIENSTDFIGYTPSFGQADYLNAAGRRLVGLDPHADLSAFQVKDFHPAEEQQRFVDEILPALARDQQWAGERTLRHFKTNAAIPVLQTIFYITERGTDRRIGIATICRDITERKQTDARLRTSLEEKEALLKEVHHRVKNNLQLITSLLNLQAAGIADPAVSELFAESRNRVRSMALVHENLYRAGNFARVAMRTHIQNLCNQLSYAYGMNGRQVQLAIEVDDLELEIDRAISAGLIINELVSNALKHAFPDGRAGRVRVELISVGKDSCTLTVRDDGVGLPLAIDSQASDSMGLQLVHDLAHQLQGTVTIMRDGGTSFRIAFDVHQPGNT
jgi:PAS domain S-box-containing protein